MSRKTKLRAQRHEAIEWRDIFVTRDKRRYSSYKHRGLALLQKTQYVKKNGGQVKLYALGAAIEVACKLALEIEEKCDFPLKRTIETHTVCVVDECTDDRNGTDGSEYNPCEQRNVSQIVITLQLESVQPSS
mmetsp:Transcript_12327/g.20038  ORF Transcript_12327/g.20038 Transcript_12327/m.20038 type:complete len:132 (+) Transcript_12327:153-548(+)|eukprot:CAMPEP_0203756454 /NCGR_PEP_ID=MMETSP0098-20131031/9744_1 /ASSEMBLY_ACC=CAM_ASM_000208 /TAXON_ID=96639 /ORGANISM=" , Strain NY0313808BC1" /LENGTH=131 /DNA_ID=CAMNT_0050648349 /DNA_START=82 /DNA_END=477 /DNA_ORIENTATION=-